MKFKESHLVYSQANHATGFISDMCPDTTNDGSILYMVEFIHETPEGIDLRHEWIAETNLRESTDEETQQFTNMAETLREIANGYLGGETIPSSQGLAR